MGSGHSTQLRGLCDGTRCLLAAKSRPRIVPRAPSSPVTAKLSVEQKAPTTSTKCYYQQSPHFLDTTSPGDCSFRQRSPQHPWKRDSTPGSRGEQIKPQYYCRSRQPVTFDSIRHLINSTILDPPPQHVRTAAVYTRKAPYEDISHLPTSGSHSL